MTTVAQRTAEHYIQLLAPFEDDIKLSIINSLSANLLASSTKRSHKSFRSFGMAKGKLNYPDDIDFCNDKIADVFGVNV